MLEDPFSSLTALELERIQIASTITFMVGAIQVRTLVHFMLIFVTLVCVLNFFYFKTSVF